MIRLRPHGILPLELWDLLLPDGSILWHHMQSPDFGEKLHAVISQVWHGTATTKSEGKVSDAIRGFRTLHLTGGGAPVVHGCLKHGPWSATTLSHDATFGSAAGGCALLAGEGLDGWCLDLGQSGFKISTASVRLQRSRDWTCLPLRDDLNTADIPQQRAALRQSIAGLLQEMRAAVDAWPRAIIAGLPSRLDDHGVPEDCSYIGMKGDVALIPDAMKQAGMPDVPLFVLNDAELAAVSARHELDLMPPALVLTLGFGVGGAMIQPT
jgi:hypothetical protein